MEVPPRHPVSNLQTNMNKVIKRFNHLPKFSDGRIDYSNSDTAPVVTVFVEFEDKILLLKRSDKVRTYRGLWNAVAGYIDEDVPIEEIAKKEIEEELGIYESQIENIKCVESFKIFDKAINKRWIVFPVLATLKFIPEIKLDWEHSEYIWVEPSAVQNYKVVFKLENSLKRVLKNI